MGFPNRGEGVGGVPDLGKIPTFSRFFLADVPGLTLSSAFHLLSMNQTIIWGPIFGNCLKLTK